MKLRLLMRALRRQASYLINTGASARCETAGKTAKLFQQFSAVSGKPLKRLMIRAVDHTGTARCQ